MTRIFRGNETLIREFQAYRGAIRYGVGVPVGGVGGDARSCRNEKIWERGVIQ